MVTFTICTNCVAPTAPFVSGGTNAKPNTSRLSCALCPSKLRTLVTPVSGPANGAATGSELGLVIIAPVARAVRVWPSLPPPLDEAPVTIRDSGSDTSWRDALITSGLLARAGETAGNKSERKKSHWRWGKPLAGTIETSWPFTALGGENLIPSAGRIANEIPPTARRWSDIKLASKQTEPVAASEFCYPQILRCTNLDWSPVEFE